MDSVEVAKALHLFIQRENDVIVRNAESERESYVLRRDVLLWMKSCGAVENLYFVTL